LCDIFKNIHLAHKFESFIDGDDRSVLIGSPFRKGVCSKNFTKMESHEINSDNSDVQRRNSIEIRRYQNPDISEEKLSESELVIPMQKLKHQK
jgi:hypothetical protein